MARRPYLEAHPPRIRQYRPRGTTPSGVIVVHTAESAPDFSGQDGGAEAVARFISNRDTYGSYHDVCDSDSIAPVVAYDQQAYGDGTGSNPHAYHVSGATQAHRWRHLPPEWTEATVQNMAKAAAAYALWLERTHGIAIPARRINRPQSDRRVPGFISHGERDPGRRTDPGADFPWDLFLTAYEQEIGEIMFKLRDFFRYRLWGKKGGNRTLADAIRQISTDVRAIRRDVDDIKRSAEGN